MTKKDLISGMIVEYRNGNKLMILKEKNILINKNEWDLLDSYNDDLTVRGNYNECDIMKIYDSTDNSKYDHMFENWDCLYLIWERKEYKEIKKDKDLIEVLKDIREKNEDENIYYSIVYSIGNTLHIYQSLYYSLPVSKIHYQDYGYIDKRDVGGIKLKIYENIRRKIK